MDHSYTSITAAAIDAIEAMARQPRDTVICDASSVRTVAAGVYWSWSKLVGAAARLEDSERMEALISGMRAAGAIASRPGRQAGEFFDARLVDQDRP